MRNGNLCRQPSEFSISLGDEHGCVVVYCTHSRGVTRFTLEEGSNGPKSVHWPRSERENDLRHERMVQAVREYLESHGFEVES